MRKSKQEEAREYWFNSIPMLIPRQILFSDKMGFSAKMIYALIYEASNHGEIEYIETNKQIAKQIKKSSDIVSRAISELKSLGLIKTELIYREDGGVDYRRITW